ncbi:MAG: hypothetical protein Kow0022_02500 [Phycisphaerales bacterium]
MKRQGVLVTVLFAVVLGVLIVPRLRGVAPTPAMFDEQLTLDAALERSAQSGKPVLAIVTADWCGACQSFKRGALADPEIEQMVRTSFVPVSIDADRQTGDVARIGRVEYLPTSVVIRGGREVERAAGAMSAERFAAMLRRALSESTPAG